MQKVFVFILLFIFVFAFSNQAASSEITAQLQKKYQEIETLKTKFTQKLINAASGESEKRTGMIAFKRPKYIYWETKTPEKELLIVNKEFVWQYFSTEQIAYKYSIQDVFQSKTLLQFITGEVNLSKDFNITQKESSNKKNWIKLKLIPKEPDPSLVKAYIWIDEKNVLLRKIWIEDYFGNENKIVFEDIKINQSLSLDLFSFEPPDSVEVIDNRR